MQQPSAATPSALLEAVAEVDRHLSQGGWDQPTRVYALVRTGRPHRVGARPLAQTLGLPHDAGRRCAYSGRAGVAATGYPA